MGQGRIRSLLPRQGGMSHPLVFLRASNLGMLSPDERNVERKKYVGLGKGNLERSDNGGLRCFRMNFEVPKKFLLSSKTPLKNNVFTDFELSDCNSRKTREKCRRQISRILRKDFIVHNSRTPCSGFYEIANSQEKEIFNGKHFRYYN